MEVQNRPPSIKFHLDEKKLRKSRLTRGVGGVSFVDQSINRVFFLKEWLPQPSVIRCFLFTLFTPHTQLGMEKYVTFKNMKIYSTLNIKIFLSFILLAQLWRVPRTDVQHSEALHSPKPVLVSCVAICLIYSIPCVSNKLSSFSNSDLSPSSDSVSSCQY